MGKSRDSKGRTGLAGAGTPVNLRRAGAAGAARPSLGWGQSHHLTWGGHPTLDQGLRSRPTTFVLLVALAAIGCDADLGTVHFQVPAKVYRFGTTRMVWATAPEKLPDAACSADPDCCSGLSEVAVDCSTVKVSCQEQHCGMMLLLERAQPLWLVSDVPDLALIDKGALSRLRISKMSIHADDPRDDAPLGEVALYFGDPSAQTSTDRTARLIGAVPRMRVGGTGLFEASLSRDAATALRVVTTRPQDPISMIAVSRVAVGPNQPVPRGEFGVVFDLQLTTALGL